MKMKKVIAGIVAVTLAGGLVGGGVYMKQKNGAKPVKVYTLEDGLTTSYWGNENGSSGMVTTDQTQTVYLSDTLIVNEVLVEEGQTVKKGDVLMTYDTTLNQVQLDKKDLEIQQKELDLKKAQSDLAKIRTYRPGKRIPEKDLVSGGLSGDAMLAGDTTGLLRTLLTAGLLPAAAEIQAENPAEEEGPEAPEESTPEEPGQPESTEPESSSEETEESSSEETTRPEESSTEETSEEEPTEEPEEPDPTEYPLLLAGRGTEEDPYIYRWDSIYELSETLLEHLAQGRTITYAVLQLELEPVGENSDPSKRRIVLKPLPEKPEEETGDAGTEGEEADSETAEGDAGGESSEEEEAKPTVTYPEGSWFELVIRRTAAGCAAELKAICIEGISVDLQATEDVPLPEPDEPDEPDDPIGPIGPVNPGTTFTAQEIAQMLAEAQERVRDLDLDIRIARAELKKMIDELNNGSVISEIDGVVKAVRDEETARLEGAALIDVSGGGGFYVKGAVGELDMDGIREGMTVTVRSYMNFMTYEGQVTEVSDYPADNGYYSGMGNYNVTYYEYTVFIDESAELQAGEYVELTYKAATDTGDTIYLENFMFRTENGTSYVYADNGEGRLEKREIRTGKSLWGSYTEIKSGITMADKLAFPYGKDAKDGARCEDGTMEELWGGY